MKNQIDSKSKKQAIDFLKKLSKEDILGLIRMRLSFNDVVGSQLRHIAPEYFSKEHRRFEMSGYDSEPGQCTKHNMAVLNEFADLGIYDYTDYLFLDFYKGSGTLYLKYFNTDDNLEFDLNGYGTTEIIYEIFVKTIFSGKEERRRG